MEKNKSKLSKIQQFVIIAVGLAALYILLAEEAAAGETLSALPGALPQGISLQIILNSALDH